MNVVLHRIQVNTQFVIGIFEDAPTNLGYNFIENVQQLWYDPYRRHVNPDFGQGCEHGFVEGESVHTGFAAHEKLKCHRKSTCY